MEPTNRSVVEGGRTDELPQDRLWFLEGMDRVNQAIQDTEDLQQTSHVLDAVLSIFGCDRAWIVYPCDPDSQTFRTVADCARPTFAHSVPVGADMPMDAATSEVHRLVRASEVPVCFGTEPNDAISDRGAERLVVRSQICLAIYPKIDQPYMLGLDQCMHARSWTEQEQRLFAAIGQRIATLLTSLLLSRDLQESKARLEEAQRVAHVGYWDWNIETNVVVWSDETYRIFGVERGERPMDFETVRALSSSPRATLERPSTAQWMWNWRPACIRLPTFGLSLQAEKCARCTPSPQSFGARCREIRVKREIREDQHGAVVLVPFKTSRRLKRAEDARAYPVTETCPGGKQSLAGGSPTRIPPRLLGMGSRFESRYLALEETCRIFGLALQVGSDGYSNGSGRNDPPR